MSEILGISPAAIGNWKVRGVPLEHCAAIERATNGAVTRQDLRPDDWQDIWPELAQPTADDHTGQLRGGVHTDRRHPGLPVQGIDVGEA